MAKFFSLVLLWVTTAVAVSMLGYLVLGKSGAPLALLIGAATGYFVARALR